MIEFVIYGNAAIKLKALAPGKKLTPRLANLPLNEARAMLDAMIAADGNKRKDGRLQFIQKSKDTIDLMQLLAVRLGYKTVLSQRKCGTYALFMTDKRWLTLRTTNGKHDQLPRKEYKGTVWCPHTLTGFWLARRRGRAFITGNTFPPNLIAPLIRASCPRRACPECGAPYAPVAERTVGNGKLTPKTIDAHHARGGTGIPTGTVGKAGSSREDATSTVTGYRPTCEHEGEPVPGIVLDIFGGSGTTGMVAKQLMRRWVVMDISRPYLDEQAKIRTSSGTPANVLEELPLFTLLQEAD
ncbi:MAG: site-specific DNA-methyltransferase [Proteobacteria bacterium]|nr:site-specific DNA-methyltransferase [Pseudomonadota bacterium]